MPLSFGTDTTNFAKMERILRLLAFGSDIFDSSIFFNEQQKQFCLEFCQKLNSRLS